MSSVNLQDWIGRTQEAQDILHAQPARFMQATLDRTPSLQAADALPPLWHWLYFLEAARARDLGRDAHPKRGGFLPPVALPRRMWAGGRFKFHAPLLLGAQASKQSTIADIKQKTGRSGALCFVTVRHEMSQDGVPCISEDHDIVYREDPNPDAPSPPLEQAPDDAEFSVEITPTEALLFRYSALTFNGHRIHYDAEYARDVEGYSGLVFHGPLTATLLLDLACAHTERMPISYEFRGVAPLSGLDPFHIEGRFEGDNVHLWARRCDGALAMRATATF